MQHLDGGLLLERVGRELGRLGVDVDRGAVGARGAGRGVLGRAEGEALERGLRLVAGVHRRGERAVEVHVDALVARGVGVREVRRQRLMALAGALDGALEGKLRGVEEHWNGISLERNWRSVRGPTSPVREAAN